MMSMLHVSVYFFAQGHVAHWHGKGMKACMIVLLQSFLARVMNELLKCTLPVRFQYAASSFFGLG